MKKNISKKQKILKISRKLFMKYSISRVTVKEISERAGVSKKTIYNYFDSKNDLQKEVVMEFLNKVTKKVNSIYNNDSLDFYRKIEKWINFASKFLFNLSEVFIKDIQNNHPDLWDLIEKYRRENILKLFSSIIKRGKKEGIVKDDVNIDFLSELFYRNIKIVTDVDFIYKSENSLKKNIINFVEIFFTGILKSGNKFDINI